MPSPVFNHFAPLKLTDKFGLFKAACKHGSVEVAVKGKTASNLITHLKFVEECFHIAVQFWLPPSSFLVRAGALYLLYGLYYYQLAMPKAKIRVTKEIWQTVQEFQQEAREQEHLDLDFVFQKLILDKAFEFCASATEVNFAQKDAEEPGIIPDSMKDESSIIDELFNPTAVDQLAMVHDQYQKMKITLNGDDASKPDRSLDIVQDDLMNSIHRTLQTLKERQLNVQHGTTKLQKYKETEANDEADDVKFAGIVSMQKSLKRKAFEADTGNYYKKRGRPHKQKPAAFSNDEDTAEDSDPSQKKQDRLLSDKPGRGRLPVVALYEKDDLDESTHIILPQIQEVLNMPDYDKIIPNVQKVTESETITEVANAIPTEKFAEEVQAARQVHEESSSKHMSCTDELQGSDFSENCIDDSKKQNESQIKEMFSSLKELDESVLHQQGNVAKKVQKGLNIKCASLTEASECHEDIVPESNDQNKNTILNLKSRTKKTCKKGTNTEVSDTSEIEILRNVNVDTIMYAEQYNDSESDVNTDRKKEAHKVKKESTKIKAKVTKQIASSTVEEEREPTAQEILQGILNKRKKEARLGKKRAGSSKKKSKNN